MLLNVPAWLVPAAILLLGGAVALYARWKATHDDAKSTPITQDR